MSTFLYLLQTCSGNVFIVLFIHAPGQYNRAQSTKRLTGYHARIHDQLISSEVI